MKKIDIILKKIHNMFICFIYSVHTSLLDTIRIRLGISSDDFLQVTEDSVKVVRKSFDGRWEKSGEPKFCYTCDITLPIHL